MYLLVQKQLFYSKGVIQVHNTEEAIFVCSYVHFSKTSIPNNFAHFVLIQYRAVVELLTVESDVENVSIFDKLNVFVENFKSIPIVQLGTARLFLVVKASTCLFQNVSQTNAVAILYFYLNFLLRLVDSSVDANGYLHA